MKTYTVNKTGRQILVRTMVEVGTKEENEAKKQSGASFFSEGYGRTLCYCNYLKNGKAWGASIVKYLDELTILN